MTRRPSFPRLLLTAAICAALAATASSAAAQAQPAKPAAKMDHAAMQGDHHMSGWKEMDAFHMVMMETWHPAKEKNDLKPIRARAEVMAERAQTWAKATVPAACDTPATRETVAGVATDARALAQLVGKNAGDAEVKKALAALHDRFETVEEGCKPGKHE